MNRLTATELNGSRDLTAVERVEYRERLVAAIERARADLAERVAANSTGGRFATPDGVEDRIAAGDAAAAELAAIAQFRMGVGRPLLTPATEETLKVDALHAALGLGPLQRYLENDRLEEVAVNRGAHTFAWWADGTKTYEGRLFDSDDAAVALAQRVARDHSRSGQRLDTKHPFLRVDLPGGNRFVATLGGVGWGGVSTAPLISVRRRRIVQPTLEQLVGTRMFPLRMGAQMEALTRGGAGQIIAGGMFSGKTTLLAAELAARWPDERTATFERDVLELGLFDRWDGSGVPPDVVEYHTRAANTEGEGAVEFDELQSRSRQARIDRCVLGEVVHGADAWEMLIASSGATYRSMATIHADDPTIVLDRLALYCAGHPSRPTEWQIQRMIAQTVDVIWFCEIVDTPHGRQRRVTSVREVGNVSESGVVSSSEVWAWQPVTDSFEQVNAWSPGLLDRLRRRGVAIDAMLPDSGVLR